MPRSRPSILVTGGAGFIGSHVVDRLLGEGWAVTALDSFDDFYAPALKRANLAPHAANPRFRLVEADLRDEAALRAALPEPFDCVAHLAARAGVRPSINDPVTYQAVNVVGTQNLLELARAWGTRQFVFASSSSVYGVNPDVPWREDDAVLQPISPYASSKVSAELLGHVYAHLFGIRFVALRFFTVYGPRQRPDLAIHKFARKMLRGEPIPLYGDGSSRRDYTYVGDVVQAVRAALDYDGSDYEVINVGNDRTVRLSALVERLEDALGVEARIERLPSQPGDAPQTWADVSKARDLLGYDPNTPIEDGLRRFAAWLRERDAEPVSR
jgi:UDP-glucuronate 4-epimerase